MSHIGKVVNTIYIYIFSIHQSTGGGDKEGGPSTDMESR